MKTVKLQFQGKQYIYLPKTLVEIIDFIRFSQKYLSVWLWKSLISKVVKVIQEYKGETGSFHRIVKSSSSAMHFIDRPVAR